jgi:glyoxylase-like metal-dependent hydrolase (beta-lactamase superfamily II)
MSTTLAPQRESVRQDEWPREVASDLAYLQTGIVNVYLHGKLKARDRGWVLVDAGLFGWTESIVEAAAQRFGASSRPSAIVLTHGHFDHVGALPALAERWDVPVYVHELEMPYVTGRSSYPPPDPTVGGGAMSSLSWLYPRGPIDLGDRAMPLPADGSVPGMDGYRWIHTPGHSPGHVSFFRDEDRTLIAGDAFVTVRQESLLAVTSQTPEMHGPPAYFTCDWKLAAHSVRALAALEPRVAATGHGIPLVGPSMLAALHELARDFQNRAVPSYGRYVHQPALTDADGIVSIPPDVGHPIGALAVGFGVGLAAGLIARKLRVRARV